MEKEFFNKQFCLEVWGDYACFTRPEMKVERVSYDVMTPSAARAVFEAIFWKPAIRWIVRKIEVMNPVQWTSVRRNEVGSVMSPRSDGIFIEDARQQRAGLFLKNVKYRIYAEMEFIPLSKRKSGTKPLPDMLEEPEEKEMLKKDENPGKYYAMFERRAKKGQCFNQPYLGCREFSCAFKLIESPENEELKPLNESKELGFMLYDLDFSDEKNITSAFFKAVMKNGVIEVPDWNSAEVKR
ncbi:MAG: type I-C CRISPR-associated protein Cas5c [bacterium]|jgi:CRISPR-associated protein Cas5d|nr:type I-C CRISPR-associated protein Cas5c [bacterium]